MSFLSNVFGKKETATVNDTIENVGSTITSMVSEVNPLEGMSTKDKNELGEQLTRVSSIMAYVILVLIPLLFVPILSDSFDLPKQTALFFIAGAAMLLWLIKGLITKKFSVTTSPLNLPVLAFLLVTIVSSFLADNKFAALSADTVAIAGGTFLFFLLSNLGGTKGNFVSKAIIALLASGAILGALSAVQLTYQVLAPAMKLPITFFLFNPTFSPAGSALSQVLFLVAILPLAVTLYIQSKTKPTLSLVLLGLNVLGILATIYVLFQTNPILLDHETGWKVAANSLGGAPQIVNAFFGVGPGHFIDAFTSFKPLTFNSSPWWNLRFSTSSNFYLYVLTTMGIAGLAALAFICVKFVRLARTRLQTDNVDATEKGLIISVTLSLVLFVIFPAPLTSIFVFFALLGLLIGHYNARSLSMFASNTDLVQPSLKYVVTAFLTIFIVGSGYFLVQFLIGDYYFTQAAQAAAANNGQKTYEYQIKALNFNAYNANYHLSYSQTNLALANSLAGQPNLSDQQKQVVVQLVQQALRESRVAASLQPHRAANWENLSLVYRNLINFAQGADQWAVQTENQAITLDPTNPRLRLDLGGILFAAKDYQNAAQIFNAAVNLKPDFANGHYNLAQALKQLNINDQALQQLQLTAQLVCSPNDTNPQAATSADCQKVNTEIADFVSQVQNLGNEATPSAQVEPTSAPQAPLATPGAQTNTNLPRARTQPPAQVGTQSGEIQPSL